MFYLEDSLASYLYSNFASYYKTFYNVSFINKAAKFAPSSADRRMVVSRKDILSSHNKTDQLAFNIMICAFLWECLHWVAGIICCRNLKNFLLVPFLVSTVSAHSDRHCKFLPSFSQSLWGILTMSNDLAMTVSMSVMLFNKYNRYTCLKIYNIC